METPLETVLAASSDLEQSLLSDLFRRDPDVREQAVGKLWDMAIADPTRTSFVVLIARGCLSDPNWEVREKAVDALGDLGRGQDAAFVARLCDDESVMVRSSVYAALARLSGKRYLKRLIRGLDDCDSLGRKWAAFAVSDVLGKDAGPVLEPGYRSDPDLNGKIGFAYGLVIAGSQEALEYLARCLIEGNERIKSSARSALEGLEESGHVVVEVLATEDGEERRHRLANQTADSQ